LAHQFNVRIDSLVVLEPEEPSPGRPKQKRVAIAIQCKETKSNEVANLFTEKGRKERRQHFEWRDGTNDEVQKFLLQHDLVFLAVTPFPATATLSTWQVGATTCYEALCTRESLLQWCPMVAYSGCDAHVLLGELPRQSAP
jgi:hypothetical protein